MMTRARFQKFTNLPTHRSTAALIAVVLFALLAVPAGADDDRVRLGIDAVGSDLPYFDLTLEPGDSVDLTVRFSNYGNVATGATIFAADVRTIRGGGMGMADIDDERTGATNWLDFPDEDLELEPEDQIERTVTVTVPDDTDPGEYITSVVIQNTEPLDITDDDARFDQTVRQAVAIAIDVPGERPAEMEPGDVHHVVSGNRSVVEIDLRNTGQAHLRPEGEFALFDRDGETLAESPIALDTFYAGTNTVIEVRFTDELAPGEYLVGLSLEDPETGARVDADDLALSVEDEEPAPEPEGDDGGIVGAVTDPGDSVSSYPGWSAIFGGLLVLFGFMVILALVVVLRAGQKRSAPAVASRMLDRSEPEPNRSPDPDPTPPRTRNTQKPIRQLLPPGRDS